MKIKILGFGEIGSSIKKIYEVAGWPDEVAVKEINYQIGPIAGDLLHVCIPWSRELFIPSVIFNARECGCRYVVIHSTVAPGTTRMIQEQLPGQVVVHSPVTGVHPNLEAGIKTFPRWIGCDGREQEVRAICRHFYHIGIRDFCVVPPETTELLKLMCTTYYGVCIAFHAEMKRIMDYEGVDYDHFIEWNKQYNQGYTELGKHNVVRPVFPVLDLPIGGHCVVPNAAILREYYDSPFFDIILKYGSHDNHL